MAGRFAERTGFIAALAIAAAGCAREPAPPQALLKVSHSAADRDCLARAMYFESHRGSDDGMLAVGTVVANRVKSGAYGATVCDVVAQKGQFAPGVMTRSMDGDAGERARRTADAVLAGKRHAGVREAMFFHTAGLRFPYPNMRYVLVAGGNAFYEKRSVSTASGVRENAKSRSLALAYAKADPTTAAKPIVVASLEPKAEPQVAATAAVPSAARVAPAPIPVRTTAIPAETPTTAVENPTAVRERAMPVRTISASVAPVLASSAPTGARPSPAPAFAPDDAPVAFPRSGGAPVVAANASPVADAWAAFQ